MLTSINPKLPMRDKHKTKEYYITSLGFVLVGNVDYDGYLMIRKDEIEIHFFEFMDLNPKENYGQVYIRVDDIDHLYQSLLDNNVKIHPNGSLKTQPWGQREFSLLDPDHNLLTFGQGV
ncbi:MAG: VOC family protein [Saprospiraceae bacterium]